MNIITSRFGTLEVEQDKVFSIPGGFIGFPEENSFIVVDRGSRVVWLQSTRTPELAFPAVDAMNAGDSYPNRPIPELAREAGLPGTKILMLLVAHVRDQRLCIDKLAPVVIDVDARCGAQIVLDPGEYGSSEPLDADVLPIVNAPNAESFAPSP